MAKHRKMYDNLATLGDRPSRVEKSLRALGFSTVRMTRKEARAGLEAALSGAEASIKEHNAMYATSYPVPDRITRDLFMRTVLENNCVLGGTFHLSQGGVVLGCPLTLGFNLHDAADDWEGKDRNQAVPGKTKDAYPTWGDYFYSSWDNFVSVYKNDHADEILLPTGDVRLHRVAIVLTGR